jgi:hypothetical protein
MPAPVKLLFRAEALRPKLAAFHPPPIVIAGRTKFAGWTKLLASPNAAKMKESELLPDFIRDMFRVVLGFTGPADYTIKRESLVEVDGNYADAALGRFSTTNGSDRVFVAVEGKDPTHPLNRPFKNRPESAVD